MLVIVLAASVTSKGQGQPLVTSNVLSTCGITRNTWMGVFAVGASMEEEHMEEELLCHLLERW